MFPAWAEAAELGTLGGTLRRAFLFVGLVLVTSVAASLSSAMHAEYEYVGRKLWTTVVDPTAPLNTERVLTRGWAL